MAQDGKSDIMAAIKSVSEADANSKECWRVAGNLAQLLESRYSLEPEILSTPYPHVYLKIGDLIVDPTVRQFFPVGAGVQRVFVGSAANLRSLFLTKGATKSFQRVYCSTFEHPGNPDYPLSRSS